ncbi:MAG: class I SAM-dependent methyltransferase [Candidatus Korobacteraceae bacterium]
MPKTCRLQMLVAFLLAAVLPAFALQLGSRGAQEWIKTLERPERVQSQKVEEVIARLDLKPGMVVADIGAGAGLFSRPLARKIVPGGKVYAVDVQQELLDYIRQTVKEQGISNIQTVLGEFRDPKIPSADVDLAFFNDVLHHIEQRAEYLKALASYLKPGGRIALVEMNGADPNTPHRDHPEMLVSREQIDQWMSAAGLKLAREFPELFPNTKWFLVYEKR